MAGLAQMNIEALVARAALASCMRRAVALQKERSNHLRGHPLHYETLFINF